MSVAEETVTPRLETFPAVLLRNAKIWRDRPALREKDLGIWQTWSWADTLEEVRAFSIGLAELGIGRGDHVAILGANRPRLYFSFAAAQALGAVPVPVYADSAADELVYILEHADAKLVIAEDQEQVDKILEISDQLPALREVVYDDSKGLRAYDPTHLHAFEAVQDRGRAALAAESGRESAWLDQIALGRGSDIGVMLYTSGTTGKPKGVMLSNDNVMISAINACETENLSETDEVLAYLPLAWVGDHLFSYCQSYVAGYCISCPESAETMQTDLREIGPTFFFAPPRMFEALLTSVMIRMEDAGSFKLQMFHYFIKHAERVGEDILNGKPVAFMDRLKYWLGEFFVYGPLKNNFGFSNIRIGYTAGEAIGPEIFRFYRSLGINLKQLYGQTEASIFVTVQPDGEIYSDTVGKPSKDVEIKIAENGEVLFRSPGVFVAYYKNDASTKDTKDHDGWVFSGDAGFFDDRGHLKIIDRAKDVGKLTDGSLFAPKYIENKLKFFPNIKEAVAFGDGRDHATVFVNVDLSAVGNWAERNNIAYASYQELAGHPQVYDMIREHIEQVNEDLSKEPIMAASQIKRFLVLHKELDADDGELTRTQKVRRRFVAERYADLIEALYGDKEEQFTKTEVVYEDGRKGIIEATVKLANAKTFPFEKQAGEAAE
ncbi:AMP-binding protein [Cohaesibacter celericrescens]|uniref:Long-chain fatty acid--CoA ligase n=1 Tax=Cohaesibacter celericrescens TaxID=2067669 RepID=A0A2N5XLA6_9HYPH|nr:AMP-binding protein [Cohaesibacter celericrescens]PLW75274.1 long-chain fatty acid--CoA ligase [Cohaesibacter celericrescens]